MSEWTKGPWRCVIDDTGGQWSGWPLCIVPESDNDRSVVRPGGMWPYEWDAKVSQHESVATANLIAAAPTMAEALEALVVEYGERGSDDQLLHHSIQPEPVARAMLALTLAKGEDRND
jgi:hypothetical protein